MPRFRFWVARAAVVAIAWLLGAAVAVGWPTTGAAELNGAVFSSRQWGQRIELTAPKNWRPSEERSYPSVLLWMARRDPPGRILLTAERLASNTSPLDYARRTARLLATLGFQVRRPRLHSRTGAYWMDFHNDDRYLRQAFLVIDSVGYALTLSAPDRRTRGAHLRAFDFALRTITIRRADEAGTEPDAADAPGAEGNAAPERDTDANTGPDAEPVPERDADSEPAPERDAGSDAEPSGAPPAPTAPRPAESKIEAGPT